MDDELSEQERRHAHAIAERGTDKQGRVLPICRQCVVYRRAKWELYDERQQRSGTWLYIERGTKGATEGLWVPASVTQRIAAIAPKAKGKAKPRGKPFTKGDKRIRLRKAAAA